MDDYVTALQNRILSVFQDTGAAALRAYQRGRADGYEDGYAEAVANIKRVQRQLVQAFTGRPVLWIVRGDVRTRSTFAEPHPDDFPGRADP